MARDWHATARRPAGRLATSAPRSRGLTGARPRAQHAAPHERGRAVSCWPSGPASQMLVFHFLASPRPHSSSKRLALTSPPAYATRCVRTASTPRRPAHTTGSSSGTPGPSGTSATHCARRRGLGHRRSVGLPSEPGEHPGSLGAPQRCMWGYRSAAPGWPTGSSQDTGGDPLVAACTARNDGPQGRACEHGRLDHTPNTRYAERARTTIPRRPGCRESAPPARRC